MPNYYQKNPLDIVEDCMKKGEPFFVVRAKDQYSIFALKGYITAINGIGSINEAFKASVQDILKRFQTWRSENYAQVKTPD